MLLSVPKVLAFTSPGAIYNCESLDFPFSVSQLVQVRGWRRRKHLSSSRIPVSSPPGDAGLPSLSEKGSISEKNNLLSSLRSKVPAQEGQARKSSPESRGQKRGGAPWHGSPGARRCPPHPQPPPLQYQPPTFPSDSSFLRKKLPPLSSGFLYPTQIIINTMGPIRGEFSWMKRRQLCTPALPLFPPFCSNRQPGCHVPSAQCFSPQSPRCQQEGPQACPTPTAAFQGHCQSHAQLPRDSSCSKLPTLPQALRPLQGRSQREGTGETLQVSGCVSVVHQKSFHSEFIVRNTM